MSPDKVMTANIIKCHLFFRNTSVMTASKCSQWAPKSFLKGIFSVRRTLVGVKTLWTHLTIMSSFCFLRMWCFNCYSSLYLLCIFSEIPKLQEFLKDLNDSHSETLNYVSGAHGILSLIQGASRGQAVRWMSGWVLKVPESINPLLLRHCWITIA